MIVHTRIETPVGYLLLRADDQALHGIHFEGPHPPAQDDPAMPMGDNSVLRRARQQLEEYFQGTRRQFDLPLAPRGTPFQLEVWKALASIPYGRTMSYGQLAAQLRRPSAMRAVGAANGRNPLPIVVPCHRVIGADGGLTGFSGGISIKRMLLEIEGVLPAAALDGELPLFA